MTDLAGQYERQEKWRHWDDVLARLPFRPGQRVLDLGCGVGQMSARFHRRGADVIGVDADDEMVEAARLREPRARFEKLDLARLDSTTFGLVDGIWASFVPAYFVDLDAAVSRWSRCLAPGGWIALVEMDDLFGHEPLPPAWRARVEAFYAWAKAEGRYDFECGRGLRRALERAGLTVVDESTLPDDELAFAGTASAAILEAWRLRLQRMGGLKTFLGSDFASFESSFLSCLAAPDHVARTRVVCVVARRQRFAR